MTVLFLGIFALSLLLSFVLTRSIRNIAMARGWVSSPAGERHLHDVPLPRLGGVAIFLTFVISLATAVLASRLRPASSFASSLPVLKTILIPGVLIFLLGLYDDLRPVGPYVKFSVQAIAAGLLFAAGLGISDLPVFEIWDLEQKPALFIGMNFLRQTAAFTIDYGRKELRFKLAQIRMASRA